MRVSGSTVGLLRECAAFARDDAPVPPAEPSNPDADRGQSGHAIFQAHFDRQMPIADLSPFLDGLPKGRQEYLRETYARFIEHPISRARFRSEKAFAYSVRDDSSRPIAPPSHRAYAGLIDPSHEIASTLDLVEYDPRTRRVHEGDLKFGPGVGELSDAQVRFNGMSAARAYDADAAVVTIIHVTPDGVEAKQWEMSRADLDDVSANIRKLAKKIPKAEPKPGLHCRQLFCPIRGVCGASLAVHTSLARDLVLRDFEPQTPEDWERALHVLQVAPEVLKWFEAAVYAQLARMPGQAVTLPDGRVWAQTETHPRTINLSVPGVESAIYGAGLGDAITKSVSRDALEKAVRALPPASDGSRLRGKGVETVVEALIAGLESIKGAVTTETRVSHRVTGKKSLPGPSEAD